MNLKSLIRPTLLRARKISYRNSTNYPLLSGDSFSRLADFVFDSTESFNCNLSRADVRSIEIIFCKSDLWEDLKETAPAFLSPKIVMLGNSDREFKKEEALKSNWNVKYLIQNSFISNNRNIWTLPLGVENLRIGVNGLKRNLISGKEFEKRQNRILVGPFSKTHVDRDSIDVNFEKISECYVTNNWLEPSKYAKIMQDYKFVACIRGNGIDTHRVWETLYRGGVPIVADDEWSRSLSWLKLPIKRIAKWDPVEIREVYSSAQKIRPTVNFNSGPLFMPFWEKFLKTKI